MRNQVESFLETRTFREFYFVAIALLLAFGTLQTLGTFLGTEKPVVTVISCSMYPFYNVGDIIMVTGTTISSLEPGDVIVYDAPDSEDNVPIVHRVVEVHDDHVETLGDNNRDQLDFEKDVRDDQIVGKALFSIPRIGGLKLLAMDLAGLEGAPLIIDSYPTCNIDVPLDEREHF